MTPPWTVRSGPPQPGAIFTAASRPSSSSSLRLFHSIRSAISGPGSAPAKIFNSISSRSCGGAATGSSAPPPGHPPQAFAPDVGGRVATAAPPAFLLPRGEVAARGQPRRLLVGGRVGGGPEVFHRGLERVFDLVGGQFAEAIEQRQQRVGGLGEFDRLAIHHSGR